MSRAEAVVLIHNLTSIIEDLRDMQWSDTTPQHVVVATEVHIKYLQEAASELAKIHKVHV